MTKIPKGIPGSKRSLFCSNCGIEIPQIRCIAKILPDVDIVPLFREIIKHQKKTNALFERAISILRKPVLKSRHME